MSKKFLTVRKARNTLKPPIYAPSSDILIPSLHTNACQIHVWAGGAQPVSPGGYEKLKMMKKKALNVVWLQRPQNWTCQGHAEFAPGLSLPLKRLWKTGMICYLHESINTTLSYRCMICISYWELQFPTDGQVWFQQQLFVISAHLCNFLSVQAQFHVWFSSSAVQPWKQSLWLMIKSTVPKANVCPLHKLNITATLLFHLCEVH